MLRIHLGHNKLNVKRNENGYKNYSANDNITFGNGMNHSNSNFKSKSYRTLLPTVCDSDYTVLSHRKTDSNQFSIHFSFDAITKYVIRNLGIFLYIV